MPKRHIKLETTFEKDVNRWKKKIPDLQNELKAVFQDYMTLGIIRDEYDPHLLDNPALPYYGDMEFHLFDDLLVVYIEITKKNHIRFIRLGTHDELFHSTDNSKKG